MVTVTTDDEGVIIKIPIDGAGADIIRRALIMLFRVFRDRYEVNRKIFMPDEKNVVR
jgi:DNA polymerase I-like protein with 3'-5' exonuclease and polymerase domains